MSIAMLQINNILFRTYLTRRWCGSYRADFIKVAEQVLRLSEHELTFDLYLLQRLHEALDKHRSLSDTDSCLYITYWRLFHKHVHFGAKVKT